MEKVNSDDLLLKILSFLPTKVAVATSILSKRWRFLWMWLPNLDYDDTKIQQSRRQKRFRRFIKRNLPLHKAPTIENLRLKFSSTSFQPEDIKSWVGIAVSRSVCHLSITYSSAEDPAILPFILYSCKSLVTLKLEGMILVDVPRLICLSSLKTLHLRRLTYAEDKSLQLILSDCHVLEVLIIERKAYDNLSEFKIIVPSLKRLSLMINARCSSNGYVIDTPSLRYLKVKDYSDSQICLIKNMPKLEKADIDVVDSSFDKFLCSITSVKSLSLRIRVSILEAAYGDGIVFNQLEDMKLCINATNWSKLLARLLQDSPKLRALELFRDEHSGVVMDPLLDCWDEGNCVPECLLSSLETFKWRGYEETLEGRRIVEYILTNACCLKTATIMARSWFDRKMRVEMMMDLLLFFPLAPNSCEIVLD